MSRKVSRGEVMAAADRAERRSRGAYRTPREAEASKQASDAYKRALARSLAGTPRSPTAPPGFDPEAEINRLTGQINDLADKAQALTRAGKHEAASVARAKAKSLSATRAEITKRNRKK